VLACGAEKTPGTANDCSNFLSAETGEMFPNGSAGRRGRGDCALVLSRPNRANRGFPLAKSFFPFPICLLRRGRLCCASGRFPSSTGRTAMIKRFLVGVAAALALLSVVLPSPAQRAGALRPTVFAIRDARVVTEPGKVLPKATVVVRNGLIEAVGP